MEVLFEEDFNDERYMDKQEFKKFNPNNYEINYKDPTKVQLTKWKTKITFNSEWNHVFCQRNPNTLKN